jgi:hypothetical protein
MLKEFRKILLGQEIIVHTDHENLTNKTFNSDRVMQWQLFIEEYSPDLRYMKGAENVVADALSRLPTMLCNLSTKANHWMTPWKPSIQLWIAMVMLKTNNKALTSTHHSHMPNLMQHNMLTLKFEKHLKG